MPTLPDKSALGGLGSQVSGRGVPKIGDLTTGEQAVTAALGKVGGVAMGIAEEEAKQADALGLAKAQAHLSEGLHQTERYFDTDPEHKTYAPRYDVSAKRIIGEAADFIPNEYTRQKWLAGHAAQHAANSKERVLRHGLSLARQEKVGEVEDALRRHQNRALDPNLSDDDRFRVLGDIDSTVELGLQSGLITPREGHSFRDKYLGGTIRDDAERRLMPGTPAYDPDGLIKDLQGGRSFDQWLVKRESSGRPDLVNQLGYAGLYQFGAPRLAHLGLYKPGAGESIAGKWSGKKWTGEFSIPGFEEVKTLEDFKRNPEAQQAAFGRHLEMMDAEIDKAGLDKYIGQKVGGVTITHDGLRAMLHLGGLGSAKRALESGGKDDPADENGTSVLRYAREAGAQSRYGLLTPQQRHALLHNAKIAQRADVLHEGQGYIESLRSTGKPPPLAEGQIPYERRAASVLGANQYKKFEIAANDAAREFQTLRPLAEMRDEQMAEHIYKTAPNAKIRGRADAAFKRIQEMRTRDPAQAVSGMKLQGAAGTSLHVGENGELQIQEGEPDVVTGPLSEVRAAIQHIKRRNPNVELGADAEGGLTIAPGASTQDAWRTLIDARISAQKRLGIVNPKPITRREARELLGDVVGASEADFSKRFLAAVDRADAMYGTLYAKDALNAAVTYQIKEKEQREAAEGIVRGLYRTLNPGLQSRREFEREDRRARALSEITQAELTFDGDRFASPTALPPPRSWPKPRDVDVDWALARPERKDRFERDFGPGSYARESAKRAGSP